MDVLKYPISWTFLLRIEELERIIHSYGVVEILAGGRRPNPTPSEQRKCAHEFPTTDTAENTPKATFTTFTNARPFCKSDVVTDVERRYYTI